MALKLSDDDGRAVDLILDTPLRVKSGEYAGAGASHLQPNIDAASRVLSLLAAMPDEEIAPDLTGRLMHRINEAEQGIHVGDVATPDNLGTRIP